MSTAMGHLWMIKLCHMKLIIYVNPFLTSNLQNQHKTKHMHTSNTNFGGVGPFGIAFVKQSIQFRLGSAV